MSSPPCWNTGTCEKPGEKCYVHFKTASAGLAQCRDSCPKNWLCETRVPDGKGAACGPAPLPSDLVPPTDEMRSLLAHSPWGRAGVAICDRAKPPAGPRFEIECYDGGQTGNRYVMVKNLLTRAACCAGIALLPPEFDHFPQSGASCFDFRGLRSLAAFRHGEAATAAAIAGRRSLAAEELPLTPPGARVCMANVSSSSKKWWTTFAHETAAHCNPNNELTELITLTAAMYVGFAVPGKVFRDTVCPVDPGPALTMHLRSGEIFTNWRDGKHLTTHGGFQHDPVARGQPPLSFYQSVIRHKVPSDSVVDHSSSGSPMGYRSAILATSPDRANPVVGA